MLVDSWRACGEEPPEWLLEKAAAQANLEDVNEEGLVKLYMTPKLHKKYTGGKKAAAYRNPSGSKSGTMTDSTTGESFLIKVTVFISEIFEGVSSSFALSSPTSFESDCSPFLWSSTSL